MTHRINAHFEEGVVVLDAPLPKGIKPTYVVVEISEVSPATVEELAQSESGFARTVLLDSSEDVWEND